MLSSADAMGKIQQIYMEGTRPVPYLTFMNVFNDLLEDPINVVPKEPSDELKERFRAACMAVNVGVYDTEGRGDDRVSEFKEKVLPAWKAKLSADEFTKFEGIIEGTMRAKFRDDSQKRAGADTVSESGSLKTSELLRRLGIAPDEPQAAAPAREEPRVTGHAVHEEPEIEIDVTPKAPAAKPAPAKADEVVFDLDSADGFELEAPGGAVLEEPESSEIFASDEETLPRVFPTVDALLDAVRSERLRVHFRAREDMTPFATYRLGSHEVEVRLVDGNTRNYVIGAIAVGYSSLPQGEDAMDDIATDMGYKKTDGETYRRREGDFLLRIRAQADRIDMPCGYPKNDGADVVAQQIQRIHRDMGELLERLESPA